MGNPYVAEFGIRPTEYTLQIWASGSREKVMNSKTTPPCRFKEGQEYFENDRVKMAGMLEQYARKTKSFPATTEELRAVLARVEWSGTSCAIPGDIPISVCSASNPDTAIPIESRRRKRAADRHGPDNAVARIIVVYSSGPDADQAGRAAFQVARLLRR